VSIPFFQKIKLRNRIILGFAVGGAVTLLIMAMVLNAITQTTDSFKDFVDLNEKSMHEVQLSDWVNSMQRNVLSYTYQDHTASGEEVGRIYDRIKKLLEGRKTQSSQPEELDRIVLHLDNYYRSFQEVMRERNRIKRLLEEKLPQLSQSVETPLKEFAEGSADKTWRQQELSVKLLNNFLLAEKHAYNFFETLDAKFFTEAKTYSKKADTVITHMLAGELHADHREKLLLLRSLFKEHQALYTEVVQRTRTYLFLINVVMSAEAYEVLYQVKQLGIAVEKRLAETEQQIIATNRTLINTLLAAGTLLILLALILIVMITRSITEPILNMAQTFKELAAGDKETKIPPYTVNDEIGVLTEAAQVFRSKNQEMARLLGESQALAKDLQERDAQLSVINQNLEARVAAAVKQAEKQDEIIFEQMRERSISDLLMNIAHHWRQPLNVIALNAQNIEDILDYEEGNREEINESINLIVATTVKLSDIITQFSRLHDKTRDEATEPFTLDEVVELSMQLLEPQMRRNDIAFSFEGSREVVFTESKQYLIDILVTLISNAVEIGRERNIENPRISLTASVSEGMLEIRIEDNAGGIDAKMLDYLFDPYQTTGFKEQNKGLGLFFVKRIVENAFGGSIDAENIAEGARFIIRVPYGK